jgi:predicted dehydrogenase
MRFGIIGCGDIAENSFAPSLVKSDLTELVAVCRRDLRKAKAFADTFGCPAAYASDEEVLDDPNVHAVVIATPPNVHCDQTLRAAAAGKHVLVEKPMGMNAAECRRMIEGCRKAGVKLAVAYRRRVFPQVLKAKALIADGAIGRTVSVRTHYSGRYGASLPSWRLDPVIGGGGAMMDMAVHRIEVLLNFAAQPTEVSAMVETVDHDWQVDDSCGLLIRFEDGTFGVHSTVLTSPPRHDTAQIDGTEGRILMDPLEFGTDHIVLEKPGKTERVPVASLEAPYFDQPMIEDFVRAVDEDREPACDGMAGFVTQAVVDAAYRSAIERREVSVEQLQDQKRD